MVLSPFENSILKNKAMFNVKARISYAFEFTDSDIVRKTKNEARIYSEV